MLILRALRFWTPEGRVKNLSGRVAPQLSGRLNFSFTHRQRRGRNIGEERCELLRVDNQNRLMNFFLEGAKLLHGHGVAHR